MLLLTAIFTLAAQGTRIGRADEGVDEVKRTARRKDEVNIVASTAVQCGLCDGKESGKRFCSGWLVAKKHALRNQESDQTNPRGKRKTRKKESERVTESGWQKEKAVMCCVT